MHESIEFTCLPGLLIFQRRWKKHSRWGRCYRSVWGTWWESPPPAWDPELDLSPWKTHKTHKTHNHTLMYDWTHEGIHTGGDLWYLSGRRVRSRRSTRRMPRIRFPPDDAMETRMSTMDTNTSSPSRMFQLLWRYTPFPKYRPIATTLSSTHRQTHIRPTIITDKIQIIEEWGLI